MSIILDPSTKGLVEALKRARLVLPAMQRPFVWPKDKIVLMMDSLMREFPLGSLLLWQTRQARRYRPFSPSVSSKMTVPAAITAKDDEELLMVLDGQQRLTGLYVAFFGSYDGHKLALDLLSGDPTGKHPSEPRWDFEFRSDDSSGDARKTNAKAQLSRKTLFVPFPEIVAATRAGQYVRKITSEHEVTSAEIERISDTVERVHDMLRRSDIHIITKDDGDQEADRVEEMLEIFVRINSGAVKLEKEDLLHSLLDMGWNDIRAEMEDMRARICRNRPFSVGSDDILKSLLLFDGLDTRFDSLVRDRKGATEVGKRIRAHIPIVTEGWLRLTQILTDKCSIMSGGIFSNNYMPLLPFVVFLARRKSMDDRESQRLAGSIYVALMSGVFSRAEARMSNFSKQADPNQEFPIGRLIRLVQQFSDVWSVEDLLRKNLNLTLNIVHDGLTIDDDPQEHERDHIFPRSTLLKEGRAPLEADHFANMHFIRKQDNRNKTNISPDVWFKSPGSAPPYSETDLQARLISEEMIQPGNFEVLIDQRSKLIKAKALSLFSMTETDFAL